MFNIYSPMSKKISYTIIKISYKLLLLRFLCLHMNSIWHTRPSCVPSLHRCGWPFCLGLCFLNLLNYLHHWFFQLFLFLLITNIICFHWLSIFEHLFFSCYTSCCNINIHHIHICNDCLCLNNRLNFLLLSHISHETSSTS